MELEFSKKLLLCLGICLWLYWLWTRRHYYRFAFQVPGYFGLPITGILYRIKHPKLLLTTITQFFKECKSYTISVWFGLYPVLLTAEPDLIARIFSSPDMLIKAEALYLPMLNIFFEGGIIASPVKKWQHNRKFINPCFSHKVLLSFLPVFHKAKNQAIAKMDALVGHGENKIALPIQQIILGTTVETTLGKLLKEGDEIDEALAVNYSFMMKAVTAQAALSFVNLAGLYAFYRRFNETRKYIRLFVETIVLQKVANGSHQFESPANDQDNEIKKSPKIFIDQAVQIYYRKSFDWMDLISESHTIVAASFETTSNCVFSTLVLLAMHPKIQEKLYDELCCVFPAKDFEMNYEHMEQLPYLDMVINESMRLAPPVPLIGRQVDRDTQITDDLHLPKGLQIFISIFDLHRRTDIWGPNAANFDPDNFLPINITNRHSYAFIPFSKGVRNCIGWRYAMFSVKTMIAGLIRNFRFTTSYKYENLRFSTKVALWHVEEPALEVFRR